jgi:hypothetical protein
LAGPVDKAKVGEASNDAACKFKTKDNQRTITRTITSPSEVGRNQTPFHLKLIHDGLKPTMTHLFSKYPRKWIRHQFSALILPMLGSAIALIGTVQAQNDSPASPTLVVKKCDEFKIDGQGRAQAWSQTDWIELNRRPGGELSYSTRIKMLYSKMGIYILFEGTDKRLTATMTKDFDHLWTEDVYECFFWTDEEHPIYFEYEISPLGYELPILVPNLKGRFLGWRPWMYEGDRKTQKATFGFGQPMISGGRVDKWSAEVFIPYQLLEPLGNVPPQSGTQWRANFYRMDYDDQKTTAWDWARVGPSFHDFKKFGILKFE